MSESLTRNIVFISKATPGDDEFVLWLAPRLEAAGYTVFADILSLEAGDRWRKQVTATLQTKATKMLLCCRDSSLSKDGVQEEVGIAQDVARELGDPRFIIPIRLEPYKKLFGIGELQYVDFVGSWARGLRDVLDAFERQHVPRSPDRIVINPNWESYKNRLAIKVDESPELLTMNWLRISRMPRAILYYQPRGAIEHVMLESACRRSPFPVEIHLHGFFTFARLKEVNRAFADVGRFRASYEYKLSHFLDRGSEKPRLRSGDAANVVSALFSTSWESFCRRKGLYDYPYSNWLGFHVTESQVALGKRIPWGKREKRRSAMLRNSAGGKSMAIWRIWSSTLLAVPSFPAQIARTFRRTCRWNRGASFRGC
jgi:hypothetical protein